MHSQSPQSLRNHIKGNEMEPDDLMEYREELFNEESFDQEHIDADNDRSLDFDEPTTDKFWWQQ